MVVFTCEPNWFDPLDRVWVAAEVISPLGESVYFMLTLIERQPLRVHFEDASLQVGQALTLLNFGTATDDSLNCLLEEDDSHWFIRHASRADGVFRVRGLKVKDQDYPVHEELGRFHLDEHGRLPLNLWAHAQFGNEVRGPVRNGKLIDRPPA